MMSQLSGTNLLDTLRLKFVGRDGLTIEEFVEAVLEVLPPSNMTKSRTETTVDLIELFRDIDVNGDGTVDWSELLAFTIEAGVVATRKEVLPVFFKFSNTDFLDTASRGAILHLRYLPAPFDAVAVVEEKGSALRFYHPKDLHNMADILTISDEEVKAITAAKLAIAAGKFVPSAQAPGSKRDAPGNPAVPPIVNCWDVSLDRGLVAVAQSNDLITLWSSPGLAHASQQKRAAQVAARMLILAQAAQRIKDPNGDSSESFAEDAEAAMRSQAAAAAAAAAATRGRAGRKAGDMFAFSLRSHFACTSSIYALAWCGDVLITASSTQPGCFAAWDVEIGRAISLVHAHDDVLTSLCVIPNDLNLTLATASLDKSVCVWTLPRWKISADGTLVIANSGMADSSLGHEDPTAGTARGGPGAKRSTTGGGAQAAAAASASAGGSGGRNGKAARMGVGTASRRASFVDSEPKQQNTRDTVSPQLDDREAESTCQLVMRIRGHAHGVHSLIFIESASLLISAGFDLDAIAYDVTTGKQALRLRGHRVPIIAIQEVPAAAAFEAAANGAMSEFTTMASIAHLTSAGGKGVSSSVGGPSRCMTMDLGGLFRVWDLASSFTGQALCVQTFDVDALMTRDVSDSLNAPIRSGSPDNTGESPAAPAERAPASGLPSTGHKHGSYSRIGELVSGTSGSNKRGAGLRSTFAVQKEVSRSGGATAAAAAAASTSGIHNKQTPRQFVVASSTCRLILGGSRLSLFQPTRIESTAEKSFALSTALFNPITKTFLAFADRTIRVFDLGGNHLSTWFHMSPTPITSAITDPRKRKLILGTQGGTISVHNCKNGGALKFAQQPHKEEITSLFYEPATSSLVSASWDRTVTVHDEKEQDALLPINVIKEAHSSDITAVTASPPDQVGLVASGSSDFSVRCFDFTTGNLEGVCRGHVGEITSICFVPGYPLLLSTDSAGTVIVFATRPCPADTQYTPMLSFKSLAADDDRRGLRRPGGAAPPQTVRPLGNVVAAPDAAVAAGSQGLDQGKEQGDKPADADGNDEGDADSQATGRTTNAAPSKRRTSRSGSSGSAAASSRPEIKAEGEEKREVTLPRPGVAALSTMRSRRPSLLATVDATDASCYEQGSALLWDAPAPERIMTYCPPITASLLVAVPLNQLPTEIVARLSPVEKPLMQARAASGTIPGAPALNEPEPHRRLLILGDDTGRIKIFDADAIVSLCNLPSLAEIVDLALEDAQVDTLDHERIEAVGRAARRSSLTIVALQKRRSSLKKMDVSGLQDTLAAGAAAATAAAAADAGTAAAFGAAREPSAHITPSAKQERRRSVSSVEGEKSASRTESAKQPRASSARPTPREGAKRVQQDPDDDGGRNIVHATAGRAGQVLENEGLASRRRRYKELMAVSAEAVVHRRRSLAAQLDSTAEGASAAFSATLLAGLHEDGTAEEGGGYAVRAQLRRASSSAQGNRGTIMPPAVEAGGRVRSMSIADVESGMHPDMLLQHIRERAARQSSSRAGRRRRSSWADIRAAAIGPVSAVEATARVPLLLQWQAHGESIRTVQLIEDHSPFLLMTAASDGTLRLWTLSGTPMGNFTPEETLGASALSRAVSVNQGVPLDEVQMAAAASADMKIPWRFRLDEREIARANMAEGAE